LADDVGGARHPVGVQRDRVADAPDRAVLDRGRVALEAIAAAGLGRQEENLEADPSAELAPGGDCWELRYFAST
jgi:hypothetical protein